MITIRPVESSDRSWIEHVLSDAWGSTTVVSRGVLHDASALPGFIAESEDEPIGLATCRLHGVQCELVTLNCIVRRRGAGTALIDAVADAARVAGCTRLWCITTNDNVRAVRFYQKRGFTIAALHRNALDESRKLKPQIPLTGIDGIPLRDEIELELML